MESQQEEDQSKASERQAAQGYAEAIASGDTEAAQQALSILNNITQRFELTTRNMNQRTAMVEALTHQLQELEAQQATLDQKHQEVQKALWTALRYKWAGRFQAAAQELISLAAHLNATEKRLKFSSSLEELHLPLFAPDGPKYLGASSIKKTAEGITLDQLLVS